MNTPHDTLRPTAFALVLLSAVALGACATKPMPMQEMAVADAAVQRASSTRTAQLAPMELGVAVGKLSNARAALAAGNAEQARRLAREATADAQVADLHADAVQATAAAKDSEDAARVLREEIGRKAPR